MGQRYSRLTLTAQQGKHELVVMLRRRGRQQTVLLDGQLVCSRNRRRGELTLGPAASSFEPSSLREAIDQLTTTIIGRRTDAPKQEPDLPPEPGANDQLTLPIDGPIAHRCERCSRSMFYEGPERPTTRLCPPCQLLVCTQYTQKAGAQVELISAELTAQLTANRSQPTKTTLKDLQEPLRRLQAIGESLRRRKPQTRAEPG